MMKVKVYDDWLVSEPYDEMSDDIEIQHEAIIALERTLDEILSK